MPASPSSTRIQLVFAHSRCHTEDWICRVLTTALSDDSDLDAIGGREALPPPTADDRPLDFAEAYWRQNYPGR